MNVQGSKEAEQVVDSGCALLVALSSGFWALHLTNPAADSFGTASYML